MDVMEALSMARAELDKNGLTDWDVAMERNVFELGRTDGMSKQMLFSAEFAERETADEFRETLLHEVAHAKEWQIRMTFLEVTGLAKDLNGAEMSAFWHDDRWARLARSLGATNPQEYYAPGNPFYPDDRQFSVMYELHQLEEQLNGGPLDVVARIAGVKSEEG